jgi:hypothetical protein
MLIDSLFKRVWVPPGRPELALSQGFCLIRFMLPVLFAAYAKASESCWHDI